MARQNVLICGASGFIGRNLVQALSGRDDLRLFGTYLRRPQPSSPVIQLTRADLTRQEDVERVVEGMDVIIQAAATTSGAKEILATPYYHVTDNAVMSSLLLRAAHLQRVKHFVFFSCSIMYPSGDRPLRETDLDENAPIHDAYFGAGWTKLYIEKMCRFFSRLGQTRFTVLRHTNIYGPHDKFDLERSHVLGATVTKVLDAPPGGSITVWGDGTEERDLLYVSDLTRIVEAALQGQPDPFGLYNVGSGRTVPIRQLVQTVVEVSGKDLRIEHDRTRPTIKTRVLLDISKARAELGWEPRVELCDGLARTIAWCRAATPLAPAR